MANFDYRLLLLKYIQHVGEAEGVSFLGDFHAGNPLFTKKEWDMLQELDKLADSICAPRG